ncbi:hypothetical protein, partial [Citrobacter freundii]|uniref:hypothetical protein n=1 Tax=Citrobacter freundii TaxID=546 RepID=UPI003979E0BE
MVLANRCHRQNMKTSIINGSEVSRLSVAIHIDALVKTLIKSFPIKQLGGHREFASLNALGRACPGTYGLQIAANLRKKYKLESPQKQ